LFDNFEQKEVASVLFEKKRCSFLVNGGFYFSEGGNNFPLGLFVSEGRSLSDFSSNNLLNGVLSVNQFGVVRITRSVPSGDLRWAVQTGPLVWENGGRVEGGFDSEKKARRVVAIVTGENRLYFVVFYNADSVYLGPSLSQLPDLLSEFSKERNIILADAVNLDGGNASSFLKDDLKLIELSPLGSYFCEK
jgi:uncharacterized protein YigE (DUF2233 family)